jgi:hypothetical protein
MKGGRLNFNGSRIQVKQIDKLNNARCATSRFLNNKKRKYMKEKINGTEKTKSKNKNIRDL